MTIWNCGNHDFSELTHKGHDLENRSTELRKCKNCNTWVYKTLKEPEEIKAISEELENPHLENENNLLKAGQGRVGICELE